MADRPRETNGDRGDNDRIGKAGQKASEIRTNQKNNKRHDA
jgi:hypothetical protein